MTRRMRIACWITSGADTHTHTHTEYELLIAVPRYRSYPNTPQYCVYTPVFFMFFRNQILCLIYDLRDSKILIRPYHLRFALSPFWAEKSIIGDIKRLLSFHILHQFNFCKFSDYYSKECSESFLVFRTVNSLQWGISISEEYVTSLFNGDPENRDSMFERLVPPQ